MKEYSGGLHLLSEDEKALAQFLASHQTAKLEDLVDIIRPQAVKHDDVGVERFTEYNVSNLNDIGQISKLGKVVNVLKNDLNRAEKQTIQQNDVLVVCKGAVGKVGVVETQLGSNAIASQAFSILRVKPHINSITPTALFQYLNSKYGQLQLASLVTGTTALMLSAKDLSSMLIPLFPENKIQQANQVRTSVIEAFKQIEQAKLHVQMHIEDNVDESCHEECCTGSCDCSHGNCFTIWLLTGNYHYKIKSFDYVFSLFEGDLLRSPPSRLLRPPIA